MVRANMTFQGLMLSKCLVAWWIILASKSIMTCVNLLVSAKPSSSQEFLSATLPVTIISPLLGMRAFDMHNQMLVVCICLVTTVVCALEWPLITMGVDMGGQSCWSVERLLASFVGTFDSVQF